MRRILAFPVGRSLAPFGLVFLLGLPAEPQDPPVVDRAALAEFLAAKKLKPEDFGFDLAHLASMPDDYLAAFASERKDLGHSKLYRRIQKAPVTFPEEVRRLVDRGMKGEPLAAAADALDATAQPVKVPAPVPLEGLPAELAEPVGRIVAAIGTRDAAAVLAAIDAAKPALLAFHGDVDWEKDGMVVTSRRAPAEPPAVLWIKFGGDDTYLGAWARGTEERPVAVAIDTGGNDAWEAPADGFALGAGKGGIGILVDLAGNDAYTSTADGSMGAGFHGVGVLLDEAGNDRYVAANFAQGAGREGIGILLDRAGNDQYEVGIMGQGFAGEAAFGLLFDASGDDDYLSRDPSFGHPVTVPAPQDPQHNACMVQGACFGRRDQVFKAGGFALLLDGKGNDRYRAGCWAQGVGYFLGVGALVDEEGDDRYEAWVYAMGAGAHGGQGIVLERRGDDTYTVGGWNAPGMAVDYAIGFFLDGAGNDRYLGGQSGHGRCFGLGIALFQDAGGDDVYEPKDRDLGFGKWYEREDYNCDGQVTDGEKRHWGIFLDLGGLDHYPAEFGNGKRWDPDAFCGGMDVMSEAERRREAAAREKLTQWLGRKEVQALLEKRRELEKLRTDARTALGGTDAKAAEAALAKLEGLWAQRKKVAVKSDLPAASGELDRADPGWRAREPFAAANAGDAALSLENAALTAEERAAMRTDPDLAKQPTAVKALLGELNAWRRMLGAAPVAPEEALVRFAVAGAKGAKPDGFAGEVVVISLKGKGAADALARAGADRAKLAEPQWTVGGAASAAGGAWTLVLGKP